MWKHLTLIARERDKEIQIDRQKEREREREMVQRDRNAEQPRNCPPPCLRPAQRRVVPGVGNQKAKASGIGICPNVNDSPPSTGSVHVRVYGHCLRAVSKLHAKPTNHPSSSSFVCLQLSANFRLLEMERVPA